MASLLTLTNTRPVRTLAPGEILIEKGESTGELYILESGHLVVIRDGVEIAVINEPGALIGEMSVLLGVDHSASVRAQNPVRVRVIEDAINFLERSPLVALHVATLACERLDRTSRLLAELRRESEGKTEQQGLLSRIFSTLTASAPERSRGIEFE